MHLKQKFLTYFLFKKEETKFMDDREKKILFFTTSLVILGIITIMYGIFNIETIEIKVLLVFTELLFLVSLYDRLILLFLYLKNSKETK